MDYKRICREEKLETNTYLYSSIRKKWLMKIVSIFEKEDLIPFLLMALLNVKCTKDDFDGFIEKLYEGVLR